MKLIIYGLLVADALSQGLPTRPEKCNFIRVGCYRRNDNRKVAEIRLGTCFDLFSLNPCAPCNGNSLEANCQNFEPQCRNNACWAQIDVYE